MRRCSEGTSSQLTLKFVTAIRVMIIPNTWEGSREVSSQSFVYQYTFPSLVTYYLFLSYFPPQMFCLFLRITGLRIQGPPAAKFCNVSFPTISAASVQKLGLVSLGNLVSLTMLWILMKSLLKVYSAHPLATHLLNLHKTVTGLVKQDFP